MAKRVRGPILTLDRRVLLKKSFDDGDVNIYNPVTDEMQTYQELLIEPNDLIHHSTKLGSGTYGVVNALKNSAGGGDVAVMKITGCVPYLIGYMNSPFRAEQIEPRLLNYLWNAFVASGITPHIIAPYGTHAIVKSVTKDQLKEDAETKSSLMYFMEKADGNTMRDYLGYVSKRDFDTHCRALLFQVAYTLGAIYMTWPKFRHNDLKDDNILLHHTHETGYTKYTIGGRTFYVPCIGVTAAVSDFDFACISGAQFDNFKVIEQSFDTPSYNINARENQYADMYILIHYIRFSFASSMSPAFKTQLDELYGTFRKGNNSFHIHPMECAPTVMELFTTSELFDEFASAPTASAVVHETYVAKATAYPLPQLPASPGDVRHCPIFRPRKADVKTVVNASMAYFNKLTAHAEAHDNEHGNVYSAHVATRLLNHVRIVYSYADEPDDSDMVPHDFLIDDKDECVDATAIIAHKFIDAFHVPFRWWAAVYTCAFVDACYDMAIVPEGQRCWRLEAWCQYWEMSGETVYSPLQLLHFTLTWEWLRQ